METSQETKQKKFQWPRIGMRNIKTAIAATLCALVYYFFDHIYDFFLSTIIKTYI